MKDKVNDKTSMYALRIGLVNDYITKRRS